MSGKNNNRLSTDQLISLLNIYETEWQHRDNQFWSQVFKLFYLSIFIIALPLLSSGLGIKLPLISRLIFPITGIFATVFSYYVSICYALRLKVTRDTVHELIKCLPPAYQLRKVSDIKYGKYFSLRQALVIPTVIFLVELILAVVLFYCIQQGLMQP